MTTMTSRRAVPEPAPVTLPPDGSDSRSTEGPPTPRSPSSSGSVSPAAIVDALPDRVSPQGTKTAGRRVPSDTRGTGAAGTDPVPAAIDPSATTSHTLLDPALCLAADILDDIERVRIANENRLRQLTRTGEDSDGEERGLGLDPDHPDVMRVGMLVYALEKLEHDATLELQRKLRKHPLGPWMKAQRGIGEKQGARLLAAIGDPYLRRELIYRDAEGNITRKLPEGPRTVSALWAYCGLHVLPGGHRGSEAHLSAAVGDQYGDTGQSCDDNQSGTAGVAAKRRKGERANWSTKAKMRAYLIAESCLKQLCSQCKAARCSSVTHEGTDGPALRQDPQDQGHRNYDDHMRAAPSCACSPYRVVYDQRRAHTAVTRPEWTDGHSHNDALRVASKAILRDLWREAKRLHEQGRAA